MFGTLRLDRVGVRSLRRGGSAIINSSGRETFLTNMVRLLKRPFAMFVCLVLLAPAATMAQAPPSVLVAPFVNISGADADDWIGDGIAETVLVDFEQLDAIAVIRPEDAEGLATAGTDNAAIEEGRRLGAAWLVAGGYQRLGDSMRITARLVDTETGNIAAGIRVDGDAADLFGLQDQVVAQLGDALANALEQGPMAAAGSPELASPSAEGFGTDGFVGAENAASNGNGNGNGNGGNAAVDDTSRTGDRSVGDIFDRALRGTPGQPSEDDALVPRRPAPPRNRTGGGLGVPPSRVPARPNGAEGGIELPRAPTTAGFGVAEGVGILTGRPTIRPPRVAERPRIDGRLDDAVWRDAIHLTEFVQQNPVEGAPASEETDVWIAYDTQNIYIAVHAHYSDPGIMRANRIDRDQAFQDDNVSIYFDTFLDQQRAYRFSVNGYGVQGDAVVNARGFSSGGRGRRRGGSFFFGGGAPPTGDSSWDALFDSGGQIVEDGFTAEMAIPFKSLRYPQRERDVPHRWGFQVVRDVRSKDEYQVWAPVTRNVSGFLTQMGVLEGLTNLSLSRNLEFLPTFTAIQHGSLNGSTFATGDAQPEGGLNVKYGITSNLVADVTFNPDFSQIESDLPQIEVNQRFALRYPELRPFFLEGAEIFQMTGPITFLHTRQIVDPEFGAKLTGKVGNTTIGVFAANDEAPGRVDEGVLGFGQKANNFAGRARYDLYAESYIGTLFTHRAFMGSHSTLGGIDANFRLGRTQSVGFKAMQSDHLDMDGISRQGQLFDASWRLNSRHWSASIFAYALSPDFRHDLGFVRRVDQQRIFSRLGYTFRPEGTIVSWGPSLIYAWNQNYDGVLEDEEVRGGFRIQFARNISLNVDYRDEMERFRGINFEKRLVSLGGQINTSRRLSFGGYYRRGDEVKYEYDAALLPYLGYGSSGSFYATVRPVSRFQSDINLSTSDFFDPRSGEILVFDVKILRALSTYQFTDRFLLRNITEYNTFDKRLGLNLLFTYRVNAGTAFYIGYDDHYRQGDLIYDDLDGDGYTEQLFPSVTALQRTNRAVFTKFQYLFRY
ncbi:MAG: hypothetical protein F4Z04_11010 [Acidobacteria bacterium]|nr:hypothetical protein [Acidobacteriota bacterium]MYD69267.1 hypothetical protein [Acidobacteriota bacterium]